MRRDIPLTDPSLEAEITSTNHGNGVVTTGLLFTCPICLEANDGRREGVHSHLIPFEPHGKGRKERGVLLWDNPSGSTLADLTLAPSYLCRAPQVDEHGVACGCRFHCFIRKGVMQVLSDSKKM